MEIEYILVIIDHFTRYAQAYLTKNKASKTVAEKLFNNFVLHFGFPARIYYNQGREFENSAIFLIRTTLWYQPFLYHALPPIRNGQVECFNRTLSEMLPTLPKRKKMLLERQCTQSCACLQLLMKQLHWIFAFLFAIRVPPEIANRADFSFHLNENKKGPSLICLGLVTSNARTLPNCQTKGNPEC